jgi:hypothetical protein
MEYISVQQAAKNWGVSERRVQQMCEANMINGAKRFSRLWMIPEDAVKPPDRRYKNVQNKETKKISGGEPR